MLMCIAVVRSVCRTIAQGSREIDVQHTYLPYFCVLV